MKFTREECHQLLVGLVALLMGVALLFHLPHAVVREDGPDCVEWIAP